MGRSRILIVLLLSVVFIAIVVSVISMTVSTNESEKENASLIREKYEEEQKNREMSEVIGADDDEFKKFVAENDLDYADGDEKIYVYPNSEE